MNVGGRGWRVKAPVARAALAAVLAATLAGAPFFGTAAAESPAVEDVCSVADSRLAELSGLATGTDGWYAIADGGTSLTIFELDRDCAVRDVITNPTDPYDVEDLARAADGTLWLGDTGDNRKRRETVALHEVSPDGTAVLYRLTYPDGAHDAEALLLDDAGTPYIITKNVLGNSDVYRPAGPMESPGPTPLEHVGTLDVNATDTPGGPLGTAGSLLITGANTSPDGTVIAVRTYTDAYLYPVRDGDVLAALRGEPVRVPLPDEPQGEAIAFDHDGTMLSASEGTPAPVRAVRNATALVTGADQTEAKPAAGAAGEAAGATTGPEDSSGVPTIPGIAIAIVVAAALAYALTRWKRRRS